MEEDTLLFLNINFSVIVIGDFVFYLLKEGIPRTNMDTNIYGFQRREEVNMRVFVLVSVVMSKDVDRVSKVYRLYVMSMVKKIEVIPLLGFLSDEDIQDIKII